MTTELRPCPFCGGEARVFHVLQIWWAACPKCPESQDSIEAAIDAWNQRAGDADTERLDSRQIIIGNCWWTDVDLRAAIDAARKDGAA